MIFRRERTPQMFVDARGASAGRDLIVQQAHEIRNEWSGKLADLLGGRAPPPPDKYVGRAAPMQALRRTLLGEGEAPGKGRAALWGPAGQGKSVLALAYAKEEAGRYPGGCYRVVVENQTLEAALAAMLPAMPQFNGMSPAQRARMVSAALSGERACLLIIDNVDDAAAWADAAFRALVPSGRGHVIVTTRVENLPGIAGVPVERLDEGEAVQLLTLHCPNARDAAHAGAVQRIVRAVEGLAVAVASIGAVMEMEEGADWAAYAQRLESIPLDEMPDLHSEVREHTGYTLRIAAALDDLYQRLPAPAQRAMDYAALLPQDLVPAADHLHGNPPETRPADWLAMLLAADADPQRGEDRLNLGTRLTGEVRTPEEFVKRLQSLGLLTPANAERTLWSMHRLHARRCRERMRERGEDPGARLAGVARCAEARRDALVGRREGGKARNTRDAAVLTEPGLRWELTPLAGTVAALWEQGLVAEATLTGTWVSVLLGDMGRLNEAAACWHPLEAHAADVEAALGHHSLATAYNNYSGALCGLGDFTAARRVKERSLEIEVTHLRPDHPQVGDSYCNLAVIQHTQGDLPAAQASVVRGIAILKMRPADGEANLAVPYSTLASIQQDQGDLAGARESIDRAIAIDRGRFAEDHPQFAAYYTRLASIQKNQSEQHHRRGDFGAFSAEIAAARESIDRAIAIREKHLPADHPQLADSRTELAMIQGVQGDFAAARENMQRAIAIQEKNFRPDHPSFAISYNNLAHICYGEGNRPSACANWRRSLDLLLKHFDERHPHVQSVRGFMKAAGCGD